jgi:hypothetical protein
MDKVAGVQAQVNDVTNIMKVGSCFTPSCHSVAIKHPLYFASPTHLPMLHRIT